MAVNPNRLESFLVFEQYVLVPEQSKQSAAPRLPKKARRFQYRLVLILHHPKHFGVHFDPAHKFQTIVLNSCGSLLSP
jgi:hypothetical protein